MHLLNQDVVQEYHSLDGSVTMQKDKKQCLAGSLQSCMSGYMLRLWIGCQQLKADEKLSWEVGRYVCVIIDPEQARSGRHPQPSDCISL